MKLSNLWQSFRKWITIPRATHDHWLPFEVRSDLVTKFSDERLTSLVFRTDPSDSDLQYSFFSKLYSSHIMDAEVFVQNLAKKSPRGVRGFLLHVLHMLHIHDFQIKTDLNLAQQNTFSFIYRSQLPNAHSVIMHLIEWIKIQQAYMPDPLATEDEKGCCGLCTELREANIQWADHYQYSVELFDQLWEKRALRGVSKGRVATVLSKVVQLSKHDSTYKQTQTNARNKPIFISELKDFQDDFLGQVNKSKKSKENRLYVK